MKRLIVVCEGATEQEFCQEVLREHLSKANVCVETPTIRHSAGGIVSWAAIKRQLVKHLHEGNAFVSMLIDYYGIKDSYGFPGWEKSKFIENKTERMHFIFDHMKADMPQELQQRFIPYIQLHEFEGLLFSDISVFQDNFDIEPSKFDDIQNAVDSFENPEMINNSPQTAPSKRLTTAIPSYNKVLDGNFIAMEIGLKKICEKCPLFKEWVERLENIDTAK